jgi:hypothetical protein
MSDNQQSSYKEAKADAKAQKAREKALRPWFKKKRFIVPIAIVAIAVASTAANSGNKSDTNAAPIDGANASSGTTKVAGIGDTVTDGNFAFAVTDVKCGVDHIGGDVLGKDAQGQYCLVSVKIRNDGKESAYTFGDDQVLYDNQDRKFSADTSAMIYLPEKESPWLTEINPGNQISGTIVYDVPKDAVLDHIEFHESAYSTGVSVSVK